MITSLRIEPLAPAHRRKTFDSGSPALDRYLREQATQDMRRRVGNCFAVAEDEKVVAYYTLSAASIPLPDIPPSLAQRLPRYPLLPAALVGRLAVTRPHQGCGLGAQMIIDAAVRAGRSDAAIHALLVEAKDDHAAAFYERLGFLQLESQPRRLFLPITTLLAAVSRS